MFQEIRKQLKIENYISFNGQYCVAKNEEIFLNPLDVDELKKIVVRAEKVNIPVGFMSIHYTKTNVSGHKYVKESFETVDHVYPIFEQPYLFQEPIFQGQLFCTKDQEESFLQQNEFFRFVRWHPYGVDIIPPNGSKLEGIKKMAAFYHVNMEHVIAFGDGLNDMEMIQNVGFGICMGNGKEELKKVAEFVTTDCNSDGIEKGLKYLGILS